MQRDRGHLSNQTYMTEVTRNATTERTPPVAERSAQNNRNEGPVINRAAAGNTAYSLPPSNNSRGDNQRSVPNNPPPASAARFVDVTRIPNRVDDKQPVMSLSDSIRAVTGESVKLASQNACTSLNQQSTTVKPACARTDRDLAFISTNSRGPEPVAPPKSFILWIDERHEENIYGENQLKVKPDVHVDFCPTFSSGQSHVRQIQDRIKAPSTTFQIICRGYYSSENKNPLDLILFLNHLSLHHIPITVYTRSKQDLESRLEKDAPIKRVHDWQDRLKIVADLQDLIKICFQNINNKL